MPLPDGHAAIDDPPDTHPNKFNDSNCRVPAARERGGIAGPPHFGLQQERQRHPRPPPPPPPPPPPGTPPPENMPQNNKRRGTDLDGLVHPSRRMHVTYGRGDEVQEPTRADGAGTTGTPKYKATDANLIPLGARRKRTESNTNSATAIGDPASVAIAKASAHTEEELPIKQSAVAATTMQEIRNPEPTATSGTNTLTPPRSTTNIVHSDFDKADRAFNQITGDIHQPHAPDSYGAPANVVDVRSCDTGDSGAVYPRKQAHKTPLRTADPVDGRRREREAEDRHRNRGSGHAEKINQSRKENPARYNRDRSRSPGMRHEERDSRPAGTRRRAASPWPRRDYRRDPHARGDLDGSSGFSHYEFNSPRHMINNDNRSVGHRDHEFSGRWSDYSYHEDRDERDYDRIDDHGPDEYYRARVRRRGDWSHGGSRGPRGSYPNASFHDSSGHLDEYEENFRRYDSREEPPPYRYERGNRDVGNHRYEEPGSRQYGRNSHARRESDHDYDGFERSAGRNPLEEEKIGQYEDRNRHRYAYDGPRGHGSDQDTAHSRVEKSRSDQGFRIKGRHQEVTERTRRRSKPDKQHMDSKDGRGRRYDEGTKHRLEKGLEGEYDEYKRHHHQQYNHPSHQKDLRLSPYEFTDRRRHYADEEEYYPIHRRDESVTCVRKPIGSYDEDHLSAGTPYDYVRDWTVSHARTPGVTLRGGHLERNGERKQNRNSGGDERYEDSRGKRKAAEYARREENPRRSGGKKRKTDADEVKGSLESRITRDPQTTAKNRKNQVVEIGIQGEEDHSRSAPESRKRRNRSRKRARRETRGE